MSNPIVYGGPWACRDRMLSQRWRAGSPRTRRPDLRRNHRVEGSLEDREHSRSRKGEQTAGRHARRSRRDDACDR